MSDETRACIYMVLGPLATTAFSLRFFIQWIASEKKGRSHVPRLFWQISLAGNLLLLAHFTVQVQYPLALIQTVNAVISYRNLDFMRPDKRWLTLRTTIVILVLAVTAVTAAFVMQSRYLIGHMDWVRTPMMPWEKGERTHISLAWHALGFIGATLFASRFWIQWWNVERKKRSYLGKTFWWISIVGSLLTLAYGLRMLDYVIVAGYGSGLVPYVRNLMLMRKSSKAGGLGKDP